MKTDIDCYSKLGNNSGAFLRLLISWLLNVQYVEPPLKGFIPGGTLPFYRLEPYPEITGYACQTLSRLYTVNRTNIFKKRAIQAAESLTRCFDSKGLFRCKIDKKAIPKGEIYIFDQGVISAGLLDVYNISDNDKFLKYALKGINSLMSLQRKDGSFPVILNYEYPYSSPHLAKINIAFIKSYMLTGQELFLECSQRLADYVIRNFQIENGCFRVKYYKKYNRFHFHCYATEGLIETYKVTKSKYHLKSIKKAGDYLINTQKSNGGFWYGYDSNGKPIKSVEDVPVAAQASRIWLFLWRKTGDTRYLKAMKNSLNYLMRKQHKIRIKYVYGGLPFTTYFLYEKFYSCSWAVEFAIEAFIDFICEN